jgi:hypothetical protein
LRYFITLNIKGKEILKIDGTGNGEFVGQVGNCFGKINGLL